MRNFSFKGSIIFLLITLFLNYTNAQSGLEDNLKTASNKEKLEIYKKLINNNCQANSKKCISYIKALEKLSNTQSQDEYKIFVYNSYALYFYRNRNFSKSIKYFEKELQLRVKTDSKASISEAYYNLGSTCYKMGKYSKAKRNFELSIKNADKIDDKDLILTNYFAIVKTYEKLSKYKAANTYLRKYLDLKNGYFENEVGLYKAKYSEEKREKEKTIKVLGNTNQTLKKRNNQLDETKNNLDNTILDLEEIKEDVEELEIDTVEKNLKIASLNILTKLSQIEIKNNNKIISQQQKITYILIIGISLVLLLTLFLFKLFLNKKRINSQLRESKKEIEAKNNHITKSIVYASKIQNALLPDEACFKDSFKDYFIIYKPRDIVSGDFYYFQKVNDYLLFAAVDCTGHGVPGAFMSMLGTSFLNSIIRMQEVTSSSQVLNLMRDEVKKSLHQTGKRGEQKDGMDMVLCAYNTRTSELQFAGAHNSLVLIRNNELIEYKGDRMPIGIHRKEKESFTNNSIKIEKGDKVYLYSDGFQDQMGGDNNKKYKAKKFKNLLLETSKNDIKTQKNRIEQEFENWKADYKQIDDIVILGISF